MVEAKAKKKGTQSRSEYMSIKKKKYPSRANKTKSNQIRERYEAKAKAKEEQKTRAQQSRSARRSGKSMKTGRKSYKIKFKSKRS